MTEIMMKIDIGLMEDHFIILMMELLEKLRFLNIAQKNENVETLNYFSAHKLDLLWPKTKRLLRDLNMGDPTPKIPPF